MTQKLSNEYVCCCSVEFSKENDIRYVNELVLGGILCIFDKMDHVSTQLCINWAKIGQSSKKKNPQKIVKQFDCFYFSIISRVWPWMLSAMAGL